MRGPGDEASLHVYIYTYIDKMEVELLREGVMRDNFRVSQRGEICDRVRENWAFVEKILVSNGFHKYNAFCIFRPNLKRIACIVAKIWLFL